MQILFFSPYSAIWLHSFPEALVAEALQQDGHEILYVGCGGSLKEYCLPMSAFGLSSRSSTKKKERVCALCRKNKEIICSKFNFKSMDLIDLIDKKDINLADSAVNGVNRDNFLELVIDNVEVGKYSLYELLIDSKKSSLDFSANEWMIYKANLRNAIVVLLGVRKILNQRSKPDRVVSYSSIYSVNHIVAQIAKNNHVATFHMTAGGDFSKRLQTLRLGAGDIFVSFNQIRSKWHELEARPCSKKSLKTVTDHFLEITSGRSPWAYSTSVKGDSDGLRKFFRIEREHKVICATMSSYDERFAAETIGVISSDLPLIFPKQVDWIGALIHYVAKHKSLKLIIRVHPRDFPNKRECLLSDHARLLQNLLSELPANVVVNWPTDNISLYDLANIVDVFTNAWSSVGKEMPLFGLPVVLYSRDLVFYPPELNYVGTTIPSYFQQLEQALQDGWNPEWIRKAYRWGAIEYYYSLLDISESCSLTDSGSKSFATKLVNRLVRFLSPYHQQNKDCRKRAPHLKVAKKINQIFRDNLYSVLDIKEQSEMISYEEETCNLKEEVNRLVYGMYGFTTTNVPPNSLAQRLLDYANS